MGPLPLLQRWDTHHAALEWSIRAYFSRPSTQACRLPLDFLEPSRRVTCAAGCRSTSDTAAFSQRTLLDRFQVLARQPDVQSAVLAKRRLGVAGVPGALPLAAAGGTVRSFRDVHARVALSTPGRRGAD